MPSIEELNNFFRPVHAEGCFEIPSEALAELDSLLEEGRSIESKIFPSPEERARLRAINRAIKRAIRSNRGAIDAIRGLGDR